MPIPSELTPNQRAQFYAELISRGIDIPDDQAADFELIKRSNKKRNLPPLGDPPDKAATSSLGAFGEGVKKGAFNFVIGTADLLGNEQAPESALQLERDITPTRREFPFATKMGEFVGEQLPTLPLSIATGGASFLTKLGVEAGLGGFSAGVSELGRGQTEERAESAAKFGAGASAAVEVGLPALKALGGKFGKIPVVDDSINAIAKISKTGFDFIKPFIQRAFGLPEAELVKRGFLNAKGELTDDGVKALKNSGLPKKRFDEILAEMPDSVKETLLDLPSNLQKKQFESLDVAGTTLTGGQLLDDDILRSQESFIKQAIGPEGALARALGTAQTENFQQTVNEFLTNIAGKDFSLENSGELIKRGIVNEFEAGKIAVRESFDKIKGTAGANIKVAGENIAQVAKDAVEKFRVEPEYLNKINAVLSDFGLTKKPKTIKQSGRPTGGAGGPGLRKAFVERQALKQTAEKGTPTEQLVLGNVNDLLSRLGNIFVDKPKQRATLEQVKRGVEQAAINTARANPEATNIVPIMKEAIKTSRNQFDNFGGGDVVEALVSKKPGKTAERVAPEAVIDKIFKGQTKLTNLKALKQRFGPGARNADSLFYWSQIQGTAYEKLFQDVFIRKPGFGTVIDAKKLDSNLKKIGDKSLRVLFDSKTAAVKRLVAQAKKAGFVSSKKGEESEAAKDFMGTMGLLGIRMSDTTFGLAETARVVKFSGKGGEAIRKGLADKEMIRSISGAPPTRFIFPESSGVKNATERTDVGRAFMTFQLVLKELGEFAKRSGAKGQALNLQRPRENVQQEEAQ